MDDRRRSARTTTPDIPTAFRDVFRRAAYRAQGRIEPGQLEAYFDVLGMLDPYELERAAITYARRSKFMPTPAEWHAGVLAQRSCRCPKCNGLGMIVVRYYSDEPFDIAICDCKHGGHFRDDGGEAFIRDRLCLGPKNRVALLEDFGDQP